MKNKFLLFGALATALVFFIKNKAKAFNLSAIKLEAFKITGFTGTMFNTVLTVSINNPTPTPLAFNSISGTVYENEKALSTFSRDVKTEIPANGTTKFDILVDVSVANLVASALDLIANGIKTSFTIDSVTNVSGINIPVRQTFNIDFKKATNENIQSNEGNGANVDSGLVDVNTTVSNETPTLVSPEVLDPAVSTPEVLTLNYDGNLDPTGGAVITLPPPDDLIIYTASSNNTPFVAVDSNSSNTLYINASYPNVVMMSL